jgi:beta-glucosidase
LIRAFIAGTQSEPVLTTARHFPGYGLLNSTDKGRGRESAPEAHSSLPTAPRQLLLPRLQRTQAELGSWEWIPFQQAIAAGAQMIMTAHVLVPDLDPQWPATLSEVILQKILREQWQFQGLIVSDALHWGVLSSQYAPSEIAVRAVQAGVDLLLAPPQPEQAIQSICQAVERGQISRWRIEQSSSHLSFASLLAPVVAGLHPCRSASPVYLNYRSNRRPWDSTGSGERGAAERSHSQKISPQ